MNRTKEQEKIFHQFFGGTQKKSKTPTEKRKYFADYHRVYRKDILNGEYYQVLGLLRDMIRENHLNEWNREKLEYAIGCSYDYLIEHLGLTNEYILNEFRHGQYEIDHLLPKKWFKDNPRYARYMNHWKNLVITTKLENRKKGMRKVNNPEVAMFMIFIASEESIKNIESARFDDYFSNQGERINAVLKQVESV